MNVSLVSACRRAGSRASGGAPAVLLAVLLLPASLLEASETRWGVSALSTRWDVSDGVAGHTKDCTTDPCDDEDWERGNLDSSIGLRVEASRSLWTRGPLSVHAGADLSLLPTEYNVSQRDTTCFIGAGFVEGAVRSRWIGVAGRAGLGGAMTTEVRTEVVALYEAALLVPLDDGIELRVSRRSNRLGDRELRDYGVGVSFAPAAGRSKGTWFASVLGGVTAPGSAGGSDADLGSAPIWLNRAGRGLSPSRAVALRWASVTHESELESDFLGTPGNYRGKTLATFGLEGSRDIAGFRLTGAIDWIDWSDDLGLLGDAAAGAGHDFALVAGVERAVSLGGGIALVARAEQLYWLDTGIGELRFLAGVSATIR